MEIKKGSKIKVEYTGFLEDGSIFDSSKNHEPLEFEVGAEQVIKGFENAVIGMKKGEEKEVTIEPKEAYGPHNPKLIQNIPRDKMPQAKPGMILVMQLPNGLKVPVQVIKETEKEVVIDVNHPLAGKKLKFKIKILEITQKNL